MIRKYDPVIELAKKVTSETLHGQIPTKTTMELATAVLAMGEDLDADGNHRGLVIISALINFVDWLDERKTILVLTPHKRAELVKIFLEAHSDGKNYFMQADDIAKRLGEPLKDGDSNPRKKH